MRSNISAAADELGSMSGHDSAGKRDGCAAEGVHQLHRRVCSGWLVEASSVQVKGKRGNNRVGVFSTFYSPCKALRGVLLGTIVLRSSPSTKAIGSPSRWKIFELVAALSQKIATSNHGRTTCC